MRFTRLLVVAWCATVLCASLGGALSLRPGTALGESHTPHRCIHDQIVRTANISITNLPQATIVLSPSVLGSSADNRSPRTATVQADDWQPIRIGVFTEDVTDRVKYCTAAGQTVPDMMGGTVMCTKNDILTPSKKRMLLQTLIPHAIQLHEDRLNVKPMTGRMIVPPLTGGICSQFTVPADHQSSGVSGFDFVVYAAANPTPDGVVAWATTCASSSVDSRPLVGVINISPQYIAQDEMTIRVVAHELLHSLGYSEQFFRMQNMVTSVSVRGKPASLVMNSPTVVAKAREHYGCDTLSYMELEDEGGSGTASSHWERRNAKDEMMAGIENIGYYSALTIAAMEDTGFYKGNYDNADPMPWGYKAGCNLLDEKCVINGVSQYPSMFCTDSTQKFYCTSDYLSIGACVINKYTSDLPSYYQYFVDLTEGGEATALTDFCPIVEPYSDASCADGQVDVMPGSVTGADARCFEASQSIAVRGTDSVKAICAHVKCDTTSSTYQVKVQGATAYVQCPPGGTVNLGSISSTIQSGIINCPSYDALCLLMSTGGENAASEPFSSRHVALLLMVVCATLLVT